MAINTIGGSTGGSATSLPVGTSSVLKQGYSSQGAFAYTPATALPAGTYAITATGPTASTAGIFAAVGSSTIFSKTLSCALTTTSSSSSVSVAAIDTSSTTPTTSTTYQSLAFTNPYSVGAQNAYYNQTFKFKGRMYVFGGMERYVASVPLGDFTGQSIQSSYIGTGWANQLVAGAATDTFAVVSNNATSSGYASNAYTTDGTGWSLYTAPFNAQIYKASNSMVIAYNLGSSSYWTTTNGSSWTARTFPVAVASVAYNPANGTWYLSTWSAGTTLYKSSDGINWTSFTAASSITGNGSIGYSGYQWKVMEYAGNGQMFFNIDYNYSSGFLVSNPENGTVLAWSLYGSSAAAFYNRFATLANYAATGQVANTIGSGAGPGTNFYAGSASDYGIGAQTDNSGAMILAFRTSGTTMSFRRWAPTTYPAVFTFGTTSMEIFN